MSDKEKKTTKPLRIFSDVEKEKIEQMALDNCHFETIAMALDIPVQTLRDRFRGFIIQKRAEGRTELRRAQRKQINTPAMAIFLGKNELGQSDKLDTNLSGEITLTAPAIA